MSAARSISCCLLWFSALLVGAASSAMQAGPIHDVAASKVIRIGGAAISYQVSFQQSVLRNQAGVPQATISALSYVKSGEGDRRSRPVLFAWGGGPGGASWEVCFL